ncbi:MAG: SAM-dependent methyltransferase, partial [Alphaproteobacteria bacterium]
YGDSIGRVYRYSLVGSGLGALGIMAWLFVLSPADNLRLVLALGLLAAALTCLAGPERRLWSGTVLAVAALVAPVLVPSSWMALRISEYKGLERALLVPGTTVVSESSSPLALLTVVDSATIPLRHTPGLSLHNTAEPPRQLGVFIDGDNLSAITAYDGRRESLAYLDFATSALPYHLLPASPEVLVLGAGGGADILQALYHGVAGIDAVEVDPRMIDLVKNTYGDFSGGIYDNPKVRAHLKEARSFVAGSTRRWDLIQVPLLDSFATATAGVHGLRESYVYTVEAVSGYLRHLRPGGILAMTRWLALPPRDSLKLLATAVAALEQNSVAEPARRLAMIRGWNTTTLVVKNGPLSGQDIDEIRRFADERAFDLVFYPGMTRAEANRWNVLGSPMLYDGAQALVGRDRFGFIERYKFDLRPATDDRPYFHDFFRWRALPDLLELRSRGGAGLIDWGYLIVVATLVQAAAIGIVLILLPLWIRRTRDISHPDRWRIAAYFAALGLAFLFVEIAFIQRFIVFLGHPLYAIAVVLSAFLVFAGLGSGYTPWLAARLSRDRTTLLGRLSAIELSVAGIGVVAVLYLVLLPDLLELFVPLSAAMRIVIGVGLIAPLAFWMGMPFPLGLTRVSNRAPDLVPWAWGINGCASVVSPLIATIVAIDFGFTFVVSGAVVLYVAGALVLRAPLATVSPQTVPASSL